MTQRLPWQRCDQPHHFLAHPVSDAGEGLAELWWHPTDSSGPAGWLVRLRCGETIWSAPASSKQHGADQADEFWPGVTERERERVAQLEEDDDMLTMLKAAHRIGAVTVEAFGIERSTSDRLTWLIWHIRDISLFGPLHVLAEAISAELYARRLAQAKEAPKFGPVVTRW